MIRSNPPSASVWTCSNTPASISTRNPGARPATTWTVIAGGGSAWVPCPLEGGEAFIERVAVDHGDGPVHDVGQACPFALEDGGEVSERLAGLLPDGGADDLPSTSTPFCPPM